MKKYKVNAIRTDEYEIEIDENIWTEEALEAWNRVFGGCDDLEDLIRYLSFSLLRFGYERFLEGFGYVYTINKKGEKLSQYERDDDGNWIIVSDFANGIKVKIITEDDDHDFEIDELSDDRFEAWLKNQNQSNIDKVTLREIYDAMDDCDK